VRSNPLIVERLNACEHPGCRVYFILDAADLPPESLRPPKTDRELAFVAALDDSLQRDGPAPWPILVFSAPDRWQTDADLFTVASTRRIILCDQKEICRPATAILLNSLYWGVTDPPPSWVDRCLVTLVARHELYHAKRAWLRAQKTALVASAIETRLRQSGIFQTDRNGLESMVHQSIAAREEIAAIDGPLGSTVLMPAQRRSILQYREDNRIRLAKILKNLTDLFRSDDKPGCKQEIGYWLENLFRDT